MTDPAGPEIHLRVPDGERWSCRQCGFCCRFHELGPVAPATIARLEAADIAALWPPAAEAPWSAVKEGPGGQRAHFLERRDGACVFLTDRNRCAIHERLGEDHKPAFCRQFPFQVVEEIPGRLAVSLRPDCGGVHVDGGAPVRAQAAAVAGWARRGRAPAQVEVLPGMALPIQAWLAREDEILAALGGRAGEEANGAGGPREQIRRLRATLYGLIEEPVPPPDDARYALALRAALTGLEMVLDRMVLPLPSDPTTEPAEARFFRDRRSEVRQALQAIADDRPPPPLDEAGRAYLSRLLRHRLIGKRFAGGVPRAAGEHLLGAEIARACAPDGSAAALSATMTPWSRFAMHAAAQWVLGRAKDALRDLFLFA